MVCNHCTMDRRGTMMFRTKSGWICEECRDEIILAWPERPEDLTDDEREVRPAEAREGK